MFLNPSLGNFQLWYFISSVLGIIVTASGETQQLFNIMKTNVFMVCGSSSTGNSVHKNRAISEAGWYNEKEQWSESHRLQSQIAIY